MALWRRSYPEVVNAGNRAWSAGDYLEAGRQFWLAAFVAPVPDLETEMLVESWCATERAQGRRSQLEQCEGR